MFFHLVQIFLPSVCVGWHQLKRAVLAGGQRSAELKALLGDKQSYHVHPSHLTHLMSTPYLPETAASPSTGSTSSKRYKPCLLEEVLGGDLGQLAGASYPHGQFKPWGADTSSSSCHVLRKHSWTGLEQPDLRQLCTPCGSAWVCLQHCWCTQAPGTRIRAHQVLVAAYIPSWLVRVLPERPTDR